jgi:hypothetical protein
MNTQTDTPSDRSIIPLGQKGIELRTFDELFRFSGFVVKSGFAPRGVDTPEKVFLVLQMGLEIGLSPMAAIQNSMVVNGRPGFYGQLVVGLVQSQPDFVDMKTEYLPNETACESVRVTITRKGRSPYSGNYSLADAKKADLLDNPNKKDTWGKNPKTMMFWRAFHRAAIIYSDCIKGLRTVEISQDDEPGFDGAKPAQAIEIQKPKFSRSGGQKESASVSQTTETLTPSDADSTPEQPKITDGIVLSNMVKAKGWDEALVLELLRKNGLGLDVDSLPELNEQDAKVALDNFAALETKMLDEMGV